MRNTLPSNTKPKEKKEKKIKEGTLLEWIVAKFLGEAYTDDEKRDIGIPPDAVAKGSKWYQGDVYAGRVVKGKFVPASQEPEDKPDGEEPTDTAPEPEDGDDAGEDGEDGTGDDDKEDAATKRVKTAIAVPDDNDAEAENDEEEERRAELSILDDKKVDEALEMTTTKEKELKAEYDELKKKKKKHPKRNPDGRDEEEEKRFKELEAKGIGAGTSTSRAGEAMTHKAIRMRKAGKSWDEIREEFEGIVSDSDHVLHKNKDWVDAAIASAMITESTQGLENVVDVAWDTPEGREAVGVAVDFDTAADIFVTVKDPKTGELKKVGVSLKKDGRVFINNGGWKKQHEIIREGLKEQGVSDELLRKFDEASGIDTYWSDLNDQMAAGAKTLATPPPEGSTAFASEIERLREDPVYAEKVLGVNHKLYLQRAEGLLDRIQNGKGRGPDNASVDDIKLFARIAENGEFVSEAHPEIYTNMRNCDHNLTERTMQVLQENEKLEAAMKKQILNGIHLDNILGLVDRQDGDVDEFMTVYGIQPEGSVLDEDTLTGLFGPEFGDMLTEELLEVRAGNKTPQQLKDFLAERMTIDYERGTVMFSQEFPDPNNPDQMITAQYPLFSLRARSRGIGASPIMELQQTAFMAYSLSQGTPDVNEWSPKVYQNYLLGQMTSTANALKGAKKEGRGDEVVKELKRKLKELDDTREKSKAGSVNASVRPLLRSLIIRELDRIKNGN